MFIKIFITIFIVFVLTRIGYRFKKQEITFWQAILWYLLWILVLAATLWPKTTDIFAKIVGIGRGADLLIFISIVTLFFLVFKIIVKQEKMNREITKVVRKIALDKNNAQDHSDPVK